MQKQLAFLVVILLLASCAGDIPYSGEEEAAFNETPVSVPLDTLGGYITNALSGDTIQPLIDYKGNVIETGVPLPVMGQVIRTDSRPQPEISQAGKPEIVPTKQNILEISKHLTVIHINKKLLKSFTPGVDTSSFVLVSKEGDTIQTGVAIPARGRIVPCQQPRPVMAPLPRMKDQTSVNLKFLDVELGMNSSYVLSLLEDHNGRLWFGTLRGGVTMYNGATYTHFTQKEGLSDNTVRVILEDTKGNLWFGTDRGGVCMYNGETFTHFTEKEGLSNNHVLAMTEDSQGNLWFGTNGGGVCKYDGESFIHYTQKEGLHNIVRGIVEDSHGNLWFSTHGGGVCMYNGRAFLRFTETDGLSSNSVMPILEDRLGNMWFGTWGGGVCKYDGNTFTHITQKEGLCHDYVNSIVEDRFGNLWFGTWEGASLYNGQTFTNFTEKEGLSYLDINSILEDHRGNIWLGTWGGGVNVYNPGSFNYFTETEGLNNKNIFSLMEDHQGSLWFGSWEGLSQYKGKTLNHFTRKEGLIHDYVYTSIADKEGNLWFGTAGGGVDKFDGKTFTHYTEKEGLVNNNVSSILEDVRGNIWIGTYKGISKYDGETFRNFTVQDGLSHNQVSSILEDGEGNLWFGTIGGGVIRYNHQIFTTYTEKEGLSNNRILCIKEDSKGNIWLGTDGGGISVFNGHTFTYFSDKQGLSNNIIRSIVEDRNQNIWIGTERGLNLLVIPSVTDESSKAFEGVQIHTYSEQNGLKGLNFYQNAVLLDQENRIWWGSGKSLTMLDMNGFEPPVVSHEVQLNRIEINGEYIDYRHPSKNMDQEMKFSKVANFQNYPQDLVLPNHLNHLTFYFSATEWNCQNKILYRFKIESISDRWSPPSPAINADFRTLPYGQHTFKVQALGNGGTWGPPFEYSFSVHPPWWTSIWFRLLVIILLVSTGIFFYHWRTRLLRARKEELEIEVKNRTAQLETVVGELESFSYSISHDLQSPLRGINYYLHILVRDHSEKLDDEGKRVCSRIQDTSNQMGQLISDILSFSRSNRMSMKPAVIEMKELVHNVFLEISDTKTMAKMDFTFANIPNAYGDKALIKQVWTNLISNAIKYSSKKENPSIAVTSKSEAGNIIYCVKDNGVGFDMEHAKKIFGAFERLYSSAEFEGTGIGLAIVQRIIQRHEGKVWAESELNKGSAFYFSLPTPPSI